MFIRVLVLACIISYAYADNSTTIHSCYVCSPCATTDGSPIVQCQPAQRYCYKEVRSDGSITRSCAVNCTSGTWTLGSQTNQYSVNCCNDKDGCNAASGIAPAWAFGAVVVLAALYLRRN